MGEPPRNAQLGHTGLRKCERPNAVWPRGAERGRKEEGSSSNTVNDGRPFGSESREGREADDTTDRGGIMSLC